MLLALDDVGFSYDDGLEALSGVTIGIDEGEIHAVVGPSGCGKSTLLSIIAGLSEATRGTVTWVDPLTEDQHVGLKLSLLFQKDTVLPWRTVERNVSFGLENLGVPKSERTKIVNDLLEVGGLEKFRKVYPRSLSGGMRRRLGLLMVMAVKPRLLLLDEPFSAVDEPTRVGLHDYVLRIAYEYGSSVILVTHDLGEAIALGDHVHVMGPRPGHIVSSHAIPFGHNRDVYQMRATSEYQDVYKVLWAATWAGRV
jgi:NitT/TauT family transport system ATP-binding protein